MIGISLYSALMIQNNKVEVDTYHNLKKDSYGFIIYMVKEEEIHTEIISTKPHFPYSTAKEAKTEGDNIVKKIKVLDLKPKVSGLQKIIGEDTKKIVSDIVSSANSERSIN